MFIKKPLWCHWHPRLRSSWICNHRPPNVNAADVFVIVTRTVTKRWSSMSRTKRSFSQCQMSVVVSSVLDFEFGWQGPFLSCRYRAAANGTINVCHVVSFLWKVSKEFKLPWLKGCFCLHVQTSRERVQSTFQKSHSCFMCLKVSCSKFHFKHKKNHLSGISNHVNSLCCVKVEHSFALSLVPSLIRVEGGLGLIPADWEWSERVVPYSPAHEQVIRILFFFLGNGHNQKSIFEGGVA